MRYKIRIEGLTGLIQHNGAAGLDTRSPQKKEIALITAKRGKNRTDPDMDRLYELECQVSLYIGSDGRPTFPESGIRAMIETSARQLKQGPKVRQGLIVDSVWFEYDESLGKTAEELGKTIQFQVPVVVQRNRILRTRAKFDQWAIEATLTVQDELVDAFNLEEWLTIGGSRIGLGDWRPEKSGSYGRFKTVSVEPLDQGLDWQG